MRAHDAARMRLIDAIFEHGPTERAQRMLLLAMAKLCDPMTQRLTASIPTLAALACTGTTQAHAAKAALIRDKWVRVVQCAAGNSRTFELLRPALDVRPETERTADPTSDRKPNARQTLRQTGNRTHGEGAVRPETEHPSPTVSGRTDFRNTPLDAVATTDENQNETGQFGNAARPSHRARVQRRGEQAVSLRDLSLDQDLNKREEEEERRERGVWGEGEDQPTPRFDPCPEPSSRPRSQPSPALGLLDPLETLEPGPSSACGDSIAALGTGSEVAARSSADLQPLLADRGDAVVSGGGMVAGAREVLHAGADGAAEARDGVADQGPDRPPSDPPRPEAGPGAGRGMAVAGAELALPGVFGGGTAPTMGGAPKATPMGSYAAGNGGEPADGFALVVQEMGGDVAGAGGAPSALELAALTAYERAIVQAILDDERAAARIRAVSPRGKRVPSLPEICRAGSLPALAVQLVELAPAVDVVRAVASAGAWLREKGQARKSGNLFLQNWMRRAQADAEKAAQREGRACVPFEYRAPVAAGARHGRSSAGELGASGAPVYAGPSAVMLPEERLDPWFRKWREEQRQQGQEPAGTREEAIAATRAMIEAKERPLRESGYYEVEERRARVARGEVTWAQLAQEWADQQRQKASATTGAGEKGVDA